jgi:ATP-binding cassette subfamily B protein
MLWLYPKLAVYVFIWCLLYLLFSYAYSIFKLPYDIKRAAADTKTTAQLADSITNNINIKLFTNYERENKRFFGVTQEQFALRKKSWDLGTIGDLIQSLLMIGLEFLIIYLGIKDWQRNVLQVGDIALIQFYLLRISDKLWNTGRNIRNIYEAIADANEMTEILVKPHEVVDKSKARVFKFRQGAIEFSKVFFTYKEGVEVLRDFDLQIKPGEKVALIGSSGGGKSTLIKLLFRFYDIQNGKIVIDGQDISAVTQDSLRKNLSLVPQDPILFHRSLMENIRYGKPEASEAEVIEASRIAHCHEFISRFPQGYETLVGERGVKLSGGERQRVAIARAVLKNAPILVLDEATSSLDSESEMLIQDALKKLMKGKTVIVVAHRLSTIMQMDRIIVIDGGRIVEEGKHKELLKAQEGIYQKLWNIQAGGFGK